MHNLPICKFYYITLKYVLYWNKEIKAGNSFKWPWEDFVILLDLVETWLEFLQKVFTLFFGVYRLKIFLLDTRLPKTAI